MIENEEKEHKYDVNAHKARLESIISNWDAIIAEINKLPSSEEIEKLLISIGAPTKASEIGITAEEERNAFLITKDIRDKYIGSRLLWDIGELENVADKVFLFNLNNIPRSIIMQSIEKYTESQRPVKLSYNGPGKAAKLFFSEHPEADSYKAVLYGSLAKTGKGHHTDLAVREAFPDKECKIVFDTETQGLPHENTLDLIAYKNGAEYARIRAESIGGGEIRVDGRPEITAPELYFENSYREIAII